MDPITSRESVSVRNPMYEDRPPPDAMPLSPYLEVKSIPLSGRPSYDASPTESKPLKEPTFNNLDKTPVVSELPPATMPFRQRVAGLIALVAVAAVITGVLVMEASPGGSHPANSTGAGSGSYVLGQSGGEAVATTALPTTVAPTSTPTAFPSSQPSVSPTLSPSTVPTWSSPTSSPSLTPPNILIPETATTLPSGRVVLASAGSMQLLRLVRLNMVTGTKVLAGRSYDGFQWESAPPDHLVFLCDVDHEGGVYRTGSAPPNSTLCSTNISLNDGIHVFKIEMFDFSNEIVGERAAAVRFLQKFTFGATIEEIDEFVNDFEGDARRWYTHQLEQPATSIRSLFRQGANSRYPSQNLPNLMGTALGPCDEMSRWHPHAFTTDDTNQLLEIRPAIPGYFALYVNGVVRTVVNSSEWTDVAEDDNHTICRVYDWVGSRNLHLGSECDIRIPNPPIMFVGDFTPSSETFVVRVDTATTFGSNLNWSRSSSVLLPNPSLPGVQTSCTSSTGITGQLYLTIIDTGVTLQFDRRVQIVHNSLENPSNSLDEATSRMSLCPAVPKTFLNEEFCVIGRPSCAVKRYTSAEFQLTPAIIRQFYIRNGKFVYYIQGLRLEDDASSPCSGGTSRWIRRDAQGTTCAGQVDAESTAVIAAEIDPSDDAPNIQDIEIENSNCTAVAGVTVLVGSKCWENIHPHEYNVYDFSMWTVEHPGNSDAAAADRPPPIEKWASYGLPFLSYPGHHPMSRWISNVRSSRSGLNLLGTLNARIDFVDLPIDLQSDVMAELLGAEQIDTDVGSFETCGSPGEIANEPAEGVQVRCGIGNDENEVAFDYNSRLGLVTGMDILSSLWYTAALKSADQLRQRVAWAFSQIFVVNDLGFQEREPYATYYDIFLRNALGNFRDILREVSYSPVMGKMLSFDGSRSYYNSGSFPDENYAREIMQLFSMGLYQLHDNGTVIKDSDGTPLPTYVQHDIVTLARTWTGFTRQLKRGNYEHFDGNNNYIDPMSLKARYRDREPKVDLHGGYIGDGYPLCRDLPTQSFLRKGAQYKYLGASTFPTQFWLPNAYKETDNDRIRYEITSNSSLYDPLCIPAEDGNCTFKSVVILTENFDCFDIECMMDTLSVIKLANAGIAIDGSRYDVYYEYIRHPCVFESIPEVSVPLITNLGSQPRNNWEMMCADTRVPVAGAVCCDTNTSTRADCGPVLYSLEKVTFQNAADRCAAQGQELCTFIGTDETRFRIRGQPGCDAGNSYSWPAALPCHIKVEVHSQTGEVNLVHDVVVKPNGTDFDIGNSKIFRVPWRNGSFPNFSGGACPAGCTQEAVSCVCDTHVVEEVIFTGNTTLPSRVQVVASLKVGFPDLAMFDNDTYTLCTAEWCSHQPDVFVYMYTNSDAMSLDSNTIFKVVDENNKASFFKNVIYTIKVGDENRFEFRSPVSFFAAPDRDSQAAVRDTFYETEAVLDHYFYHSTTPPFIARALIQKMVTSNPSPRYVKTVAVAFKTGLYMGFGSGKRGDLNATIAAIVLDREASSTVLDRDETAGGLREPVLKLLGIQRILELKAAGDDIRMNLWKLNVNQKPLDAPSVFNFFQYDFAPRGPVSSAGLVAPEAQIFTAPTLINYIHSVLGIAKFGMSNCNSGMGTGVSYDSRGGCSNQRNSNEDYDQVSYSLYHLSVNESRFPAAQTPREIVSEFDILLTGGRSSSETLMTIETVFNHTLNSTGNTTSATKMAYGAFAIAPEYQIIGGNARRGELRETENVSSSDTSDTGGSRPYKAIVYLFMNGGADSHNFLVPHSDCGDTDLYTEYSNVRTNMALDKGSLLQINASRNQSGRSFTQPCSRFGMHPSLETLHRLYNAGDALWVANAGPLKEPIVDADDYENKIKRPPQLYAHNVQQRLAQNLDGTSASRSDGVLGRMQEKNNLAGYKTGLYSLKGMEATVLQPTGSLGFDVLSSKGVQSLENVHEAFFNISMSLSERVGASPFVESWSQVLMNSLQRSRELSAVLDSTEIELDWNPRISSDLSKQFQLVSQIIKASTNTSGLPLDSDRDVFFLSIGGWDVHTDGIAKTTELLDQVDAALASFEAEMKAQGLWNNVTIIQASDFGRTLTSNGAGIDHAWAGNYFVAGGDINGGKIVGQYPSSLLEDHPLMLDRGRVLPTTSWEHVFNAVGTWFGVTSSHMADVLPNLNAFPQDELFTVSDLFM